MAFTRTLTSTGNLTGSGFQKAISAPARGFGATFPMNARTPARVGRRFV